jgi:hypothetical protein
MGKYSALTDYLRTQGRDEVPMTFAQIERVIGAKLPASHRYRAWWSNNSFNSVMTKAWLAAGFESTHVNMKERKLVFRQIAPKGPRIPNADASSGVGGSRSSKRHPLIGWMKGTVRIAPGVDLTEPADPEWGERAWGDQK